MTTTRITTDETLDEVVNNIKQVVTVDKMSQFLDARLTAYDRDGKRDAYITLKDGRKYLPYPYNVRLVARLYDGTNDGTADDGFDV
jgi:hypothetical protein